MVLSAGVETGIAASDDSIAVAEHTDKARVLPEALALLEPAYMEASVILEALELPEASVFLELAYMDASVILEASVLLELAYIGAY